MSLRQRLVALSLMMAFCLGQGTTSSMAATPSLEAPLAVLRALDKVTARVEEIEVHTDKPYKFGTIFITVHSCRTTTPDEPPESAAFMEVTEFKFGQMETPVFKGWMFASSPALSAMEHPLYDLWLIGCKGGQPPAEATPAAPVPEAAVTPADGKTTKP
ncbi:MAG: DUF2155 domain-containing protein [Alphaproteobacteria bacterium]|nr:DUF2155 domain-containing protein [Alphaproteobacteria bacterium]